MAVGADAEAAADDRVDACEHAVRSKATTRATPLDHLTLNAYKYHRDVVPPS